MAARLQDAHEQVEVSPHLFQIVPRCELFFELAAVAEQLADDGVVLCEERGGRVDVDPVGVLAAVRPARPFLRCLLLFPLPLEHPRESVRSESQAQRVLRLGLLGGRLLAVRRRWRLRQQVV